MKKQSFNEDWLFHKEGTEPKIKINLPHDAMIFEERNPELNASSGFYPGGIYHYEKTITCDEEMIHQTVLLEFEGVYERAVVTLNGTEIGSRIYGYSDFFVDLTGLLKEGENVIAVTADNSHQPNSRWYTGSGIYRDVWLWTGNKACFVPDSFRITTVSLDPAVIEISQKQTAEGSVRYEIYQDEELVCSSSDARITIADPKLWSAESPALYTCKAILYQDEEILDEQTIRFGLRMLSWNAEEGFKVNGNTVKLKGGCIHHDHGILGACDYKEADLRRVKKLKEFGYNAIRYAHNPASHAFLEACDEVGMYVVDEAFDQWKVPQSTYDYATVFDTEWQKDIASMVARDYNHPCVIMYGIGNEITDTGLPFGPKIANAINTVFHTLDSSRPTMIAINSMLSVLAHKQYEKKVYAETHPEEAKEQEKMAGSQEANDIITLLPKLMASITAENLEALIGDCLTGIDIIGYNYGANLYAGTHALKPDRVILSSETFPQRMAGNMKAMEPSYVIGDFQWTAWDYLGEAGVGLPVYGTAQAPFSKSYPCLTGACGSFDLTGHPEAAAYYTSTLFGAQDKPYIAVRPVDHSGEEYTLGRWRYSDALPCFDYQGCEGKTANVEVYSSASEVELFLNDVSIARKPTEAMRADFEAAYAPGTLKALAYDEEGKAVGANELKTTGEASFLKVTVEEKEIKTGDILFVDIDIVDEENQLKIREDHKVTLTITGGELLAYGNADPCNTEGYHNNSTMTYHGSALAVIRVTDDTVTIQAEAEGLEAKIVNR